MVDDAMNSCELEERMLSQPAALAGQADAETDSTRCLGPRA